MDKIKKLNDWDLMISGRLYNSSSNDIKKQHVQGLRRCNRFNRIPLWRSKSKQKALLKLIPSSKNKNLTVFAPFYCEYGVNIHVGINCFVNYNCSFLDVSPIILGNGVWIGANVTLATPNHPLLAEERLPYDYPNGKYNLEYSSPIVINDGCWICSSVTICGGVTIGENSVIAAGSIVTRDVPPNSLVIGAPARVIRKIDEEDRIDVWKTYINKEVPLSYRKRK